MVAEGRGPRRLPGCHILRVESGRATERLSARSSPECSTTTGDGTGSTCTVTTSESSCSSSPEPPSSDCAETRAGSTSSSGRCALLISLLWSLGGSTPFYHIPYALIPGTKYFRAPATIFFVGTLAIALLAGAGAERFLERRVSRKYLIGWLIAGGVIAFLASVGGLTSIAESFVDERLFDRVLANKERSVHRSVAIVLLRRHNRRSRSGVFSEAKSRAGQQRGAWPR